MQRWKPDTAHSTQGISAQGVSKKFADRWILRDANLVLPAGTITGLTGPSGAGKTTLLRILAGLELPDAGVVCIDGGVATKNRKILCAPHARGIGMVFQQPALWPHMDVRAHVGFGLTDYDPAAAEARIDETLALIGIAHLGTAKPSRLSGGEAARVALARALAPSPKGLLLDEPFAHLDEDIRRDLVKVVLDVTRSSHAATLIVTHSPSDLDEIADYSLHLKDGRLVASQV